jgi:hypothetical protein
VLVGEQFPDGAALRDLGRQHLKDVEEERIYQLSVDGQPDRFPALKTERRAQPSRAEVLGEDFEQRVSDFVTRTLQQTLAGKAPPPPGPRELPAKEIKPVLRFAFAIVCALIVGLILMIVVVKVLFF